MNKLNYCIALREQGLGSSEMKKSMKEKGFDESEIQYYIKKSDDVFLNNLIKNNKPKSNGKLSKGIKTFALVISLLLLITVLLGYARTGLIGLFIIWSVLGYSSYRK